MSVTQFCDILECLVTGLVANLPPEPWDYLSDRLSELKSRKGAYSWNMFVEEDASLQKRIFRKVFNLSKTDQEYVPFSRLLLENSSIK